MMQQSGHFRINLARVASAALLTAFVLQVPHLAADEEVDPLAQPRQAAEVIRGTMSKPVKLIVGGALGVDVDDALQLWKLGDDLKPVNPRHHFGRAARVRRIPRTPSRRDPLLDFQGRASLFEAEPMLGEPILSFEGQGFSGVNPPDTTGAVGTDYFIQALNDFSGTKYAVYKKDGSLAAGPFLLSNHLGGPAGRGDPIVLYDNLANRWLITEFGAGANRLIIYISPENDPLAAPDEWTKYSFDTPNFPDYPKYGVWPNGYYVTSNETDGPAVYALDREKMLKGEPATMQRFVAEELAGFGFQALTPSDLDGPSPADPSTYHLMRHHDDEVHNFDSRDPSMDFLDLYEFKVDWDDASNSTFSGPTAIPIAEFDSDLNGLLSFQCFPQKDSTVKLDPLREVIMWRLQYRSFATHETMIGSFVTDVDGTDHGGIRWFELRKTATQKWHVHQEGTYAPDSHNRWMSSIAMDGQGNIALAYNITSDTIHPGLRYTGRRADDPMGTMPQPERVIMEGSAANSAIRYGDYSQLSVDPSNDQTFWFTGEYNPAEEWSTRIATFEFKASGDGDTSPATPRNSISLKKRIRLIETQVKQLKKDLNALTE